MRALVLAALIGVSGFGAEASAKTYRIKADEDAGAQIQAALSAAQDGDTIRFSSGRFDLDSTLASSLNELSIRGSGPGKTVLVFDQQAEDGAPGVRLTGNQVQVRGLTIRNAKGDGLVVDGGSFVQLRDLEVEWTRPASPGSGPNGVLVRNVNSASLRDVAARGASEAGVRAVGSSNVVIDEASLTGNVVGAMLENTKGAEVTDSVIRGNAAGVLIRNVPSAPQQDASGVRVYKNEILSNNIANFGVSGALANLQSGVGVIMIAARDSHVTDNAIGDHGSANILIKAYQDSHTDPEFSALPKDIAVRGNTFGRVGFARSGLLAELDWSQLPEADVVWDGATAFVAGGMPRSQPVRIGISDNLPTRATPVGFVTLGMPFASSPMSEATPRALTPVALPLTEPAPIRLRF